MDELLNPAHGISWSAILFVAGGCYFLLRSLKVSVDENTKAIAKLTTKMVEVASKLDNTTVLAEEVNTGQLAHAKVISEIVVKFEGTSTKLVRCLQDVDKMMMEEDDIRMTITQHVAWATEKLKAIDAVYVTTTERLSRIEGKIFNGRKD